MKHGDPQDEIKNGHGRVLSPRLITMHLKLSAPKLHDPCDPKMRTLNGDHERFFQKGFCREVFLRLPPSTWLTRVKNSLAPSYKL